MTDATNRAVSEPGHVPPPRPTRALAPGRGHAVNVRAQNEFGAAPFGKALARRLVKSAGMMQSMAPSKTFPSAARDGDAVQGHCRMIERPETGPFSRPIASAACTAFAARRPPCRSRTART
ncbi:MAG: hypothetical protein OXC72_03775 [Roseovarius sp.]|nr:hypothetical protein [Roseovarius sp.]